MQSSSVLRRMLGLGGPACSRDIPPVTTVINLLSQQNRSSNPVYHSTCNSSNSSTSSIFGYDLFNGFFEGNHYPPQFALETSKSDYNIENDKYTDDNNEDASSIWDSIVLMAVPKSKKSKGKKRMKHQQHIPERVDWATCPKCQEPRRPHRICKKNLDVCGMRIDEWNVFKEDSKNSDRVAQIVKKYTFGTWKSK